MKTERLNKMIAGIEPWKDNFGHGMEFRGADDQSWYDLSMNCNSVPCEADLAIVITSWFGQLKWLKAVLTQYRLSGAFVILAYDNPFYGWARGADAEVIRKMPNPDHYLLANSVVHKHITYDADKRNGWFWDVRYAQGVLRSFPNIKNVYVTNGDCICTKPEGFKDLIELLGEDDLIGGQNNSNVIHTADFLCKIEAFNKIFDLYYEEMRVPVLGSRSPEGTFKECIKEAGIKVKDVPKLPLDPLDGSVDMYSRYDQDSTWKDLLGYKNLFAIYETLGNEGKDLYHLREYADDYMDWIYWGGEERETICQYWATGDRRHLLRFWDRWEDSDYNRLYYELEHYGKEPIYGTNKS